MYSFLLLYSLTVLLFVILPGSLFGCDILWHSFNFDTPSHSFRILWHLTSILVPKSNLMPENIVPRSPSKNNLSRGVLAEMTRYRCVTRCGSVNPYDRISVEKKRKTGYAHREKPDINRTCSDMK